MCGPSHSLRVIEAIDNTYYFFLGTLSSIRPSLNNNTRSTSIASLCLDIVLYGFKIVRFFKMLFGVTRVRACVFNLPRRKANRKVYNYRKNVSRCRALSTLC